MPSEKSNQLDALVHLLHQSERAISVTKDLEQRHYGPITGVVTNVDDPELKGRVKVKLDPFKQEFIPEEWMPVVGAFQGTQPKQLVGQKVLIAPIEGSVHLYRIIGLLDGDIGTYDPVTSQGEFDHHVDSSDYAALQDEKPLTSKTGTMLRLPVYSIPARDALPRCHAGNHGAQVVIDDGLNSFQVTCLRVKGGFGWITNQRKKYDGDFSAQ